MYVRLIRSGLYLLLGLMLGASVTMAYAGYALPAPPQGFSTTAQGFMYKAPAGVAAANGAFQTGVSVNVAGKAVTMPAAMRFAANAGQFAAQAVRLNPYLAVGAVAVYLATVGIEYVDGDWVRESLSRVVLSAPLASFSGTRYSTGWVAPQHASVRQSALDSTIANYESQGLYIAAINTQVDSSGAWLDNVTLYFCSTTQVYFSGGCVTGNPVVSEPVPNSDWDSVGVADWPFEALEPVSREFPLPVLQPELSPIVEPISSPYIDPITGQPWRDVVRITPAPTPEAPFRVRVDPYREPMTSADPDAVPVDQTQPGAPGNQAVPEDQQSICKEFPNISACQELGNPGEFDLLEQEAAIPTITPESIGGGGGSCPADKQVVLHGGAISFSWSMMCSFATGIRPVVLAMAWLIAGMGFFYAARSAG